MYPFLALGVSSAHCSFLFLLLFQSPSFSVSPSSETHRLQLCLLLRRTVLSAMF